MHRVRRKKGVTCEEEHLNLHRQLIGEIVRSSTKAMRLIEGNKGFL